MSRPIEGDGWFRFQFGSFTITAVSGGSIVAGPGQLWSNVAPEEVSTTLLTFGLPGDSIPMAMSSLVLERAGQRIVIDPGMGSSPLFGEGMAGVFDRNFAAAGFSAGQIDLVLLTHAHPDHACGLLDAQGNAAFPNAKLLLSADDHAFWTDPAKLSSENPFSTWVAALRETLEPYADRTILVKDGDPIMPGIDALPASGHTVGQLSYVIAGDKDALIVIGDVAHHAQLEARHPEWTFAFDTDAALACRTRERIYDFAAERDYLVHGFHFAWPGIGKMRRAAQGYDFIPVAPETIDDRHGRAGGLPAGALP